ncbi:glycosyltransferase [Neobacillus niacini]|uniref:glycosyltransferase n=1 Tax=Neobacillus niacini TaxID=86668 RepID=UPI0030006215
MESEAKMRNRFNHYENIFCTILSRTRLYQGLALLNSLKKVMGDDFYIFIHCIDEESYNLLKKMKWKNSKLIHEKKLPRRIGLLKNERKVHEYCWTLKPVICEYVLRNYTFVNRITYLDSDLYFFGDPRGIFKNHQDCSVLLSIEEKYSPRANQSIQRRSKITGLYNSGFISFKQDEIGLQAVTWWKEKCLVNCRIDPEEGIFGDQKYLDKLPDLFPGICDITTPGVNVGPWNELKYQFSNVDATFSIDEHLLIFFHFSGLRVTGKNKIQSVNRVNLRKRPFLYQIYYEAIDEVIDLVEKTDPTFNGFADEVDLQKYWN